MFSIVDVLFALINPKYAGLPQPMSAWRRLVSVLVVFALAIALALVVGALATPLGFSASSGE